jgi:uncharacterized coiled-coil protein SlyX
VTFIHQSAFKALKEWLDARVEATQKPLKPNDYVFVAFDFTANSIGEKPLNTHLANHMLKTLSGRAGMNGEKIWVHVLRKAFRKVLRQSPNMDDETREALMGHKLKGSQGNYFDYHDIILVAKLYNECDWGSGTASITKKLEELEHKLSGKDQAIEALVRNESELKEKILKIEGSREGIAALLKRVMDLEKKLGEKS